MKAPTLQEVKETGINVGKVILGVAFVFFALVSFLWMKEVAVKEVFIYRDRVVTVIDTVEVEVINTQWRESVRHITDTLLVIKPDTILIVEDYDLSYAWQERILRLVYEPPEMSFIATMPGDSSAKRVVYKQIDWGFIIEPDDNGMLAVQILEPPAPPAFHVGYNWGIGLGWGNKIAPTAFGEMYFGRKRLRSTMLVHLSTTGAASVGIYFKWR